MQHSHRARNEEKEKKKKLGAKPCKIHSDLIFLYSKTMDDKRL